MNAQKRGFDDSNGPAHSHQEQQSWPDLWTSVLGASGDDFDNDSSELLHYDYVGQGIEDWASDAFFDLNLAEQPSALALASSNTFLGNNWIESSTDSNASLASYICYGTITNVAVKLHGDMTVLLDAVNRTLSVGYVALNVQKKHGHYILSAHDGTAFGQINDKTEHGMNDLTNWLSVTFAAFAPSAPLRDFICRRGKSSNLITKVQLNIHGNAIDAAAAGGILSANKLYLQDPDFGLDHCEYANPHILEYPDYPVPRASDSDAQQDKEAASQDPSDLLQSTMAEVYNSTRRNDGLERMVGNAAITTPLKPHQEQALSFMLQRELGPVSAEFSLWVPTISSGAQVFKHSVTGDERSDRPSELGGGILSDDMGMGKTLSALALITQTRESAVTWAGAGPRHANAMPRNNATLVVVPSGQVLNEWLREIRKHLDGSISATTYHGRRRDSQKKQLTHSDIVLTTYHTLASSEKKEHGLAQNFEWFRIVLDEAHLIRRHATKLFQSASKLEAQYRWCLTGTPIQNSLEDFGSLLAFARIESFRNVSVFRKYIVQAINERHGEARTQAIHKFASLLDSVSLRRSQALLDLPEVTERRVLVELSDAEKRQYEDTMTTMSRLIRELAHQNKENRNILNLFQAQLQLRILCNHGTYQRPFTDSSMVDSQTEREDAMLSLGGRVQFQCTSCGILMPIIDINRSKSRQSQVLCASCLSLSPDRLSRSPSSALSDQSMKSSLSPTPSSSFSASSLSVIRADRQGYFQRSGHSSKIESLIADVQQVPLDDKCIIFSCWTRSLDLVAVHLADLRVAFGRIDGDCDLKLRQTTLDEFTTDPNVRVLLMSTGVGALGLNLTAASHIFILEPQWNPSTEQQAIGRASRIGQTKPVFVTRYLVKGTLEMVMSSQQWRKRQLAQIGLGKVDLTDKQAFQLQ